MRVAIWLDQDLVASIRVRQVDMPQIRGKCHLERELAQKAKALTAAVLPVGSKITLSNIKAEKDSGRYDADIRTADGRLLSALLIGAGVARPYARGKRRGWRVI